MIQIYGNKKLTDVSFPVIENRKELLWFSKFGYSKGFRAGIGI